MQDLINEKEIEFSTNGEHSIDVIIGTTYSENLSSSGPRPITICHDNLPVKVEVSEALKPVLVIEVPKPFPYTSNKTVPWDYRCNYASETTVIDLTSVGGITRSGRIYVPTIADKVALEKPVIPAEKEQLPEDMSTSRKKCQPIVEKKACEFLKIVKHNE